MIDDLAHFLQQLSPDALWWVLFSIYITGVVIAYFMFKFFIRNPLNVTITWSYIFFNLFVALFSWTFVLTYIFITVCGLIFKLLNNIKPPKWL